jgi:hypothetical protein
MKHPECIEEGLQFLGLEVVIPDGPELNPNGGAKKVVLADVLYRKDNRYYIVETKESLEDSPRCFCLQQPLGSNEIRSFNLPKSNHCRSS